MLTRALRLNTAQTLGHLHLLWHAALEQQEDGDLTKWSDELIAELAGYTGDAPQFVRLLQELGWLDGKVIHDWWDYAGRYLQSKYSKSPSKWQVIKNNYQQTTSRPPAIPNQPNPPNQPNQPTTFAESDKITFDFSLFRFVNLNGKRTLLREKYPAINVEAEIRKMEAWLMANPKNKKSNYERFITNWLSRAQDKARPQEKKRSWED